EVEVEVEGPDKENTPVKAVPAKAKPAAERSAEEGGEKTPPTTNKGKRQGTPAPSSKVVRKGTPLPAKKTVHWAEDSEEEDSPDTAAQLATPTASRTRTCAVPVCALSSEVQAAPPLKKDTQHVKSTQEITTICLQSTTALGRQRAQPVDREKEGYRERKRSWRELTWMLAQNMGEVLLPQGGHQQAPRLVRECCQTAVDLAPRSE
ncbi:hypothetical protein B484DRAFT_473695, partial [Ochromonadaceae sp. CCMP2298]